MMGTITVGPTGVGEINAVTSSVFPNPFNEKITVISHNANHVALYDVLGNVVKHAVAEAGQTTISLDVADLPKGIYFIRLLNDGAILATKKMNKI